MKNIGEGGRLVESKYMREKREKKKERELFYTTRT